MISGVIYIAPVQRNRDRFCISRAKNARVRKVLRLTHFMEAADLLLNPVKPRAGAGKYRPGAGKNRASLLFPL